LLHFLLVSVAGAADQAYALQITKVDSRGASSCKNDVVILVAGNNNTQQKAAAAHLNAEHVTAT